MDLYNETKLIMRKYGINANKSLGQNFLINEDAVNKIVDSALISKEDLVIEIGPGLGTLTNELLKRAGKVICIELDERMLRILNERFKETENLDLIHEDVLKVALKSLIEKEQASGIIKNVKIVANLPYYITTPIIMKLLEEKLEIESITVMIQKEVAERLTEKPGGKNTGAITYTIAYYTDASKIIDVPNSSFIPEPEVTSSVIKLEVLKKPRIKPLDEKLFFKTIKIAFMQKRKTLLNSLTNGKLLESKVETEQMLNDLNLDLKVRPENLTIEQYEAIANYIKINKGD